MLFMYYTKRFGIWSLNIVSCPFTTLGFYNFSSRGEMEGRFFGHGLLVMKKKRDKIGRRDSNPELQPASLSCQKNPALYSRVP